VAVREILDSLMFTCPGCGVAKKYEQMFEHVKTCKDIKPESIASAD